MVCQGWWTDHRLSIGSQRTPVSLCGMVRDLKAALGGFPRHCIPGDQPCTATPWTAGSCALSGDVPAPLGMLGIKIFMRLAPGRPPHHGTYADQALDHELQPWLSAVLESSFNLVFCLFAYFLQFQPPERGDALIYLARLAAPVVLKLPGNALVIPCELPGSRRCCWGAGIYSCPGTVCGFAGAGLLYFSPRTAFGKRFWGIPGGSVVSLLCAWPNPPAFLKFWRMANNPQILTVRRKVINHQCDARRLPAGDVKHTEPVWFWLSWV
jgi:hypothetical protein